MVTLVYFAAGVVGGGIGVALWLGIATLAHQITTPRKANK